MTGIEWQTSSETEPEAGSALEFCLQQAIPAARLEPCASEDGPLVFISRGALESLHDFLAHDLEREHGGVLVGRPYYDPELGKSFLVVRAAIPALEAEGSSVHLQFTPETWDSISGLIEENYPDAVVVGWYHSHPGLGVFMSGTDRATQEAFYSHPWNVAVVADPVFKKTGWFSGPECRPLDSRLVLPFGAAGNDQSELELLESLDQDLALDWERQAATDWRWLLPFGFLAAGALLLALRLKKKSSQ